MNLNLYNVLSHLIPGFVVYIAIVYTSNLGSPALEPVLAAVLAYVLGYFVSTLSSWADHFYYKINKKNKPYQLLEVGQAGRIRFAEYEHLKSLLHKKSKKKTVSNSDLFNIALRLANNEGRIQEMMAHYAFARSLAIACLIVTALLGIQFYAVWYFWVLAVVAIFMSWQRAKERGGYYVREVLIVALNKLDPH